MQFFEAFEVGQYSSMMVPTTYLQIIMIQQQSTDYKKKKNIHMIKQDLKESIIKEQSMIPYIPEYTHHC